MEIKELFSKTVLDKNANEIGKINNAEFDVETGKISSVSIETKKNIFEAGDSIEIDYEDIATIGQYILLNKEIPTKEE